MEIISDIFICLVLVVIVLSIIIFIICGILFFILKDDGKEQEKNIKKYLDECDEKLKKGEMDEWDNLIIHTYYEHGFYN